MNILPSQHGTLGPVGGQVGLATRPGLDVGHVQPQPPSQQQQQQQQQQQKQQQQQQQASPAQLATTVASTAAATSGQPIVQVQVQPQLPADPVTQSMAETWLSIASLAETLGDADRAAMAYDATLQYNPSSTKALTSLAHLYRSRDMFQRAAELYQRALSVNPELGDIWATLGHCYLMLDDLQRAYAAYQQALYHLSNPNVPKLWHGIGILYDRYGSLDYAEEAFAKVLELDPQFEKANEIYFRLGIIYKHQGKWNQALECFRYILTQPPAPLQEWDVWFQLGSVLESMSEWQGAREAYEHVLLQNERHAKVLQQLGCLYGMQNVQFYDTQTALNLLLKSLETDSTDATTWYHLGRIHMVRNDYTAAYDAFQHAVNRDSRNPIFWCSIGVLYYQISQYRDALDAYTRAIRLNPYISEVWYDLGTLYETCNNQLTDALDAYKQAARLDTNNVHIRERLEALTEQLANQSNGGTAMPPQPKPLTVTNPPPVMLQPTLQSTDDGNPLNKSSMYVQPQLPGQMQTSLPAHLQAHVQAPVPSQQLTSHQQPTPPQPLPQPQPQAQPQPQLAVHSHPSVHLQHQYQQAPQSSTLAPVTNTLGQFHDIQGTAAASGSNTLPQIMNPTVHSVVAAPNLPQKRPIEAGMDTLVNAAVSNAATPSSATPTTARSRKTSVASEGSHQKKHKRNASSSKSQPNQSPHYLARSKTVSIASVLEPEVKHSQAQTPVQTPVAATSEQAGPVQPHPETAQTSAVATPSAAVAQLSKSTETKPPVVVPPAQDQAQNHTPDRTTESKPEQPVQSETNSVDANQTVIKASPDAIEKLREEAELRKEEERESLVNEPGSTQNGDSEPAINERAVREVEEDENYDD
ncbi:LAME_0E05490g1_1 [Lachancea meyersii CBS 8951]|uniref:LAME_0E05490g1_1 n=1 Tax=Lachancea meyersii CBS 8951 TaxID=1266667 RepID=A0A1G4JHI2_9SACH|nr:LAME_0E05490g1_1 [Lachancea meyersii CBS 8951]